MIYGKNGEKYYKIALHLHSTISDGRLSPEAIAKKYKEEGFDSIALTDHWVYGEGGELCGMHVISGCEYNFGGADTVDGGVMHIVGIGMKFDPKIKRDSTKQEIIDGIRKSGGMAILAHPAWSLNSVDDLKALSGIEATEIYNAVSEVGESLRPNSSYFVDLAANKGLFPKILATDDAHYYNGSDECKGWIFVKAAELSDDAIITAIRCGDFFSSSGPELYAEKIGNKLIIDTSPCNMIGTLSNMSWASGRVLRGKNLTHHEYELKDAERWVRVEATDENGNSAWSNIFIK